MLRKPYAETRAVIEAYYRVSRDLTKVVDAHQKVLDAYARESGEAVNDGMSTSYILWLINGGTTRRDATCAHPRWLMSQWNKYTNIVERERCADCGAMGEVSRPIIEQDFEGGDDANLGR